MSKKKKDNKKMGLFKVRHRWQDEWQDMPEFVHEDLTPFRSILVHFENNEDIKKFSELIKRNITKNTVSIWYPKEKIEKYMNKRYIDTED